MIMDNDVKKILAQSGMKEKNIRYLLKLSQRKKISVSRAFFIYVWKYYAWASALLVSMLFPATMGGVQFFLEFILCFVIMAVVSVFFSPFLINLIWSVKVQIKLVGK